MDLGQCVMQTLYESKIRNFMTIKKFIITIEHIKHRDQFDKYTINLFISYLDINVSIILICLVG